MVRKSGAFFLLLLFVLLWGCNAQGGNSSVPSAGPSLEVSSEEESSQTSSVFPYTFTDSTGRQVTLSSRPQKVAVLFSSYAEMWGLAGGTVQVTVGDSVERGFAEEGTLLVDDGAGLKIDTEQLVASHPDFVIASADLSAQKEVCERLSQAGIPCAAFTEETVEDYLSILKIFTDITENPEAYETYGVELQKRVEAALQEAEERAGQMEDPVSVLFIRAGSGDSSTKAKTAKDHFVGIMLQELGAVNIADEAGALSQGLSLEHVVQKQPDVILIVPQGDEQAAQAYMNSVLEQSGWRDLEAVKNQRCWYLPKDLFHYKPNARWDEAYTYLTELLYPLEEKND